MPKFDKYDKLLVYQYGKVGSTTIRFSGNGTYQRELDSSYKHDIIQTHSHVIANDILSTMSNNLVITIVRLPVDRHISGFWEGYNTHVPNYKELTMEQIIQIYDSQNKGIQYDENWMNTLFDTMEINPDTFYFDKERGYTILNGKNGNDYLFFRFEDWDMIAEEVLPLLNININEKKNKTELKEYGEMYKNHKRMYTINSKEEEKIQNSKYLQIFYTNQQIESHINKWKKK